MRTDRCLLRIVDGALAGSILLVPFLMGGRDALGQLVLVGLAVTAALAGTARACFCRTDFQSVPLLLDGLKIRPTALLLLGGIALVALQIVPLPQALLRQLAPRNVELLPLWRTISLTPVATRDGLVVLLAYGLLFGAAAQRVRSVTDVERVLRWCALAAVLMALLGLAQLLAGNGKFYWFYEHPFSNAGDAAKGAFANRNHFAQFLALGIGPLVWWFQDVRRRRPRPRAATRGLLSVRNTDFVFSQSYLSVLALAVVLFAGLLSLSRGGITVIVVAAAIAGAVCFRASFAGRSLILGAAAAALLIGGALTIFGAQAVGRRLEDLSVGSVARLDPAGGRRSIWAAVAKATRDHWLLGSGLGSHAEVYPMYMDAPLDSAVEFTYAENSYLQVALETGIAGLALVLGGMALCASGLIAGLRRTDSQSVQDGLETHPTRAQSPTTLACLGAVAASLVACALHAAVDFTWYVPGCMTPVVLLAACAVRAKEIGEGREARGEGRGFRVQGSGIGRSLRSSFIIHHSSYLLPSFSFLLLSAVGVWMIASRIGPAIAEPDWHRYELVRYAPNAEPSAIDPRDAEAARKADMAAIEREGKCIAWLERVVRWQPDNPQAQVHLAQCHLRLFDLLQSNGVNAMPLPQLRDAAVQSEFRTRDELTAWLGRAVGDHWMHLEHALRHARESLSLCPLEGKAYVYLGELAFLEGDRGTVQKASVERALRLRPFDGEVLYAAAMEALAAGDLTLYLQRLQRSYGSGRVHREHVLRELVARAPEESLDSMAEFVIGTFAPSAEDLRFLHGVAAGRAGPEALVGMRRRLAAAMETAAGAASGPEAARLWMDAHALYALAHDGPQALRSARRAYACDPNSYDVRYALAECLLKEQLSAEAEPHLRWCLQRRPEDRTLETRYREALRNPVAPGATAARESEGRR